MASLVEFLEARIAEDEAIAKELPADAPVHHPGCYYYSYSLDAGWFCDCDDDGTTKRRLQAECAAKRAVIALYRPGDLESSDRGAYFYAEGAGDAVKALAAVYKDHPDYRQEWELG